jgi:NADH-ubiquinone oxidoreductase chain 2
VYDDTPTIVTIWLTLIPKISILILLLELHIHVDLIDQLSLFNQLNLFSFNIDTITKNLLLISSLLSLIIGSVVGLAQNRIKRLLAYSTISHIGYILLALGIYTEQSIDSFIFYIIQYIITNLNIFLIIIATAYIVNQSINNDKTYFKDIRYISEFKGQFYSNPLISISFSICLFSIAGVPPLIGFFSKQFVLYSAIQSGYNFIAIVAIILSVISASYYLKIIKTFFIDFDPASSNTVQVQASSNSSQILQGPVSVQGKVGGLNNTISFLISTLTLSILFFIFKPSLILNITQLLSLSLFYI